MVIFLLHMCYPFFRKPGVLSSAFPSFHQLFIFASRFWLHNGSFRVSYCVKEILREVSSVGEKGVQEVRHSIKRSDFEKAKGQQNKKHGCCGTTRSSFQIFTFKHKKLSFYHEVLNRVRVEPNPKFWLNAIRR